MGHHWQFTHELKLGIGLGHIRWYMDKMIIRVYEWLHSYTMKTSEENTSKVPMNWNWVLDWVISDGSSEKDYHQGYEWCTYVLELGIGLGYIHMH